MIRATTPIGAQVQAAQPAAVRGRFVEIFTTPSRVFSRLERSENPRISEMPASFNPNRESFKQVTQAQAK